MLWVYHVWLLICWGMFFLCLLLEGFFNHKWMLYFVKVWIFKGDWGSIMLVSKACLKTVSCVNIDLILSCTLNELTPFIYTFYIFMDVGLFYGCETFLWVSGQSCKLKIHITTDPKRALREPRVTIFGAQGQRQVKKQFFSHCWSNLRVRAKK